MFFYCIYMFFCCILMHGLVNVVIDVCPEVEHRWRACHIFANWAKRHRGGEIKRQFWKASWSTFEK